MAIIDSMLTIPCPTAAEIKRASKEFSYKNPKVDAAKRHTGKAVGIEPVITTFTLSSDPEVLRVPRACGWKVESADDRTGIPCDFPAIKFRPRKGQRETVSDAVRELRHRDHGGGVIVAKCGAGKTVMGVVIAAHLRMPTVILVHKDDLVGQWVKAINTHVPSSAVGVARGGKWPDGKANHFVVAMIQSVMSGMKRGTIPAGWAESFGLVIGDEAHVLSAELWSKTITIFPAMYRLGLTATPTRSDGMERVFFSSIGGIIAEMEGNELVPDIHFVEWNGRYNPKKLVNYWDYKFNHGKGLKAIAIDGNRNRFVANLVAELVRSGRKKVAVISDRTEMLRQISRELFHLVQCHYYGPVTPDVADVEAAEVIFGTYPKIDTGTDITALDTVVLASPRMRIQQVVGRALRPMDGKLTPVVYDIVDTGIERFKAMSYGRKKKYDQLGYNIKETS